MFEKMLIAHPSGIHLLGATPETGDSCRLTIGGVSRALGLARSLFLDTVVDLEDCFHAEQVEFLSQASSILLVCRLDFTSVRGTRRLLEQLDALRVQRNRVKLVANQYGLPNELGVAEAEQAVGARIAAFLPHAPEVVNAANNTGVPVVLKNPDCAFSQEVIRLVAPHRIRSNRLSHMFPNLRSIFKDVFPTRRRI
jgi:pilus assembly protein CpaE